MSEDEQEEGEIAQVVVVNGKVGKKKSKYDDPHIYDYIVEYKNAGWSNERIAAGLQEQGYEVPATKISSLHRTAIVKSTTIHNTANEKFTDYSAELNVMQGQSLRALRRLIDYINGIGDELEATEDLTTLQKQLRFVQMAPQIKMALSELRETIKDFKKDADKIINEKSAQALTTQDVIDNLNSYFAPVFKEMAEPTKDFPKGRIEIHDKTVLKG